MEKKSSKTAKQMTTNLDLNDEDRTPSLTYSIVQFARVSANDKTSQNDTQIT